MLESHRLRKTMPLSITLSRFPSCRNICPNHRGVYQKVPSLKLLFVTVGKSCQDQNQAMKYTPLLSKVSDNEPAEREGENDSNHASHVCLRDETAPCGLWHPPGGREISFVVS